MTQTFNEKLTDIIEMHQPEMKISGSMNCRLTTEETISYILSAIEEIIPNDKPVPPGNFDSWGHGWNQCREELLDRLKK